jgi:hypothetical protein
MADYNAQIDALFPGVDTTPQDKKTAKLFGKELGVSSLGSFFAGIGSGFFKIPEGLFSFGANLIDLGVGTDTAAEVEEFFAKINPFDEYAEASTAGKISEVLTNIAVPVGYAAKIASTLTKGALAAKKSGKYFKLLDDDGVPILETVRKGQKATDPRRLAQLNRKGQSVQLGATALTAGAAESIFVADPEELGTFGDLFGGGPTAMDRGDDYDPERELFNRLKLGIEGTAFTGILSTAGAGIKQLADSSKAGRVAKTKIGRALDYVSQRLRPRSGKNPQYYTSEMGYKGNLASDLNSAENIAFSLDKQVDALYPTLQRWFTSTTDASRAAVAKQLNKTLLSNLDEKNIVFATTDAISPTTGKFMKDPATVRKLMQEGLTAEQAMAKAPTQQVLKVVLPEISTPEIMKLDKFLIAEGKKFGKSLTPKERKEFITTLNDMRQGWGKLLEIEGRSLDVMTPIGGKSVFQRWKELMPQMLTERLDVGYKVFKNKTIRMADNLPPVKEVIKKAEDNFITIANNFPTPVKLSRTEAKELVDKVWRTAYLDKDFALSNKGSLLFRMGPQKKNFIAKSFAEKAAKYSDVQLGHLTGETQIAIRKLLGKDESAMSTILNGTNVLSTVIRRDAHYADQLINSNNIKAARNAKIKELMKQGLSAEEAAAKAPIQTYFNTEQELIKATGAKVGDYRKIGTISHRGEEGLEKINPLIDRSKERALLKGELDPKTGRPVWAATANRVLRKPSRSDLLIDYQAGLDRRSGESFEQFMKRNKDAALVDVASLNPLTGKWTLKGNADALYNVNKNIVTPESGWGARLYANAILYPKATSQMAKTILAPFTHMRNFLSAGAFATANGIIPFADPTAVRKAIQAIQLGPRTKEGNAFYQELLRRGVVNSQVQLGDLKNLLKDIEFGSYFGSIRAFNKLGKGLSRIKRFTQDAYTAEDDFWKIYSYLKESDRLTAAYKAAGIAQGDNFVNMAGRTVKFNAETIKDEAAAIVRNNIPNYAYVSDFVKGLRQYPLGNFVSFPAEIMRTGTNIVQRGLDEMFYTVTLPNGKVVNPLRSIGLQRLTGMAVTTSAVPYAAVAAGQALYDVSQDEIEALRRYVAKWSKNSTLIPLRGEDGKLKYIDFSHMNAYDTLTRPIQTVINRVQSGEQDKDGIMDDFIMGLIESTKELALPFISESIWTEALADLYMRGGETRDGFRVYKEKDSLGNQMYNSLAHLVKAQAPLNWKQMERIGLSMRPVDSTGKFDDRGREYEFGNELAGMIGARAIEVEPEKGIAYKIADYAKGSRQSKSLFTTEVLKGGPITPKAVYDAYINANRALFNVQQTMARDIEAAKILGMTDDQMQEEVADRLGDTNYAALEDNSFRPMKITQRTFLGMEDIATQLGIANPLEAVIDTIEELQESLSEYSLYNERLPKMINPFDTPVLSGMINKLNTSLPPTTGFIGENNLTPMPSDQVGADGLTDAQRAIVGNDSLYAGIARKSNLSKQKPTQNLNRGYG